MSGLFPFASVAAGYFVGVVFVVAGTSKLLDRLKAIRAVEAYALLPRQAARPLGALLPWIELAIALSLLTGMMGRGAAVAALILLVFFSVAQAIVLLRGQQVLCGCFGSLSSRPVRWTNVWGNVVLSVLCLLAASTSTGMFDLHGVWNAVPSALAPSLSPGARILAHCISAGLFLEFMIFRQILENRHHQQVYLHYEREVSAALAIQGISNADGTGRVRVMP